MLTFPSFLHIFIIIVIQKRSNKGLIPHCLFALACNAVIVSITKFSVVIGSPLVYLSRNRCAITRVSNVDLFFLSLTYLSPSSEARR